MAILFIRLRFTKSIDRFRSMGSSSQSISIKYPSHSRRGLRFVSAPNTKAQMAILNSSGFIRLSANPVPAIMNMHREPNSRPE